MNRTLSGVLGVVLVVVVVAYQFVRFTDPYRSVLVNNFWLGGAGTIVSIALLAGAVRLFASALGKKASSSSPQTPSE
ncbi:MAG: hypothetical protein Q3999_03635 [Buchananella hordeovulneris]|nr:hypothetical protein [Buchananella hordeovulneris]